MLHYLLALLLLQESLGQPDPSTIRQCSLTMDAMSCCDFPKLVTQDSIKSCIQDHSQADQTAGIKRIGPPGGMCLFKCFASGAGILDSSSRISQDLVSQQLQSIISQNQQYSSWPDIAEEAVSTSYGDYLMMQQNDTFARQVRLQDPTCYPSTGYFLARLNGELFTQCPTFNTNSPQCVSYRQKVESCGVFIVRPSNPVRPDPMEDVDTESVNSNNLLNSGLSGSLRDQADEDQAPSRRRDREELSKRNRNNGENEDDNKRGNKKRNGEKRREDEDDEEGDGKKGENRKNRKQRQEDDEDGNGRRGDRENGEMRENRRRQDADDEDGNRKMGNRRNRNQDEDDEDKPNRRRNKDDGDDEDDDKPNRRRNKDDGDDEDDDGQKRRKNKTRKPTRKHFDFQFGRRRNSTRRARDDEP